MPKVKFDCVVSVSSEDPENPASNLLLSEISSKKWLYPKGIDSGSVVLRLSHLVQIVSINIGVHNAAFVEIQVSRSESSSDNFEVLVPRSIFLSPTESRNNDANDKVRTFNSEQFLDKTKQLKWDRLRVICSQPYNKHCKVGISFIHIFEPENKETALPQAVTSKLVNFYKQCSDDEEDGYKPGDLFEKYKQGKLSSNEDSKEKQSTDSQIRQASLQALKNKTSESKQIVKTEINKATTSKQNNSSDKTKDCYGERLHNKLLYKEDEEKTHSRIDKIVDKHNSEKAKKEPVANSSKENTTPVAVKRKGTDKKEVNAKRSRLSVSEKKDVVKDEYPVSLEPHTILKGVVFVLSGYENPRRAQVRAKALAMGARFERDWSSKCTHLICAFPNTPKLRSVRNSRGGSDAVVVTADWVEAICDEHRRLPWQWYATEAAHKIARPDDDVPKVISQNAESECDTDDEIEKMLEKQKRKRKSKSPDVNKNEKDTSKDNKKQRKKELNDISLEDNDSNEQEYDTESTDDEMLQCQQIMSDTNATLPDFFDNCTFVIHGNVGDVGFDQMLLKRYIQTYGGEVLDISRIDESTQVNYMLTSRSTNAATNSAIAIRPDWVWNCHEKKRLCKTDNYLL